ncbi:MAG: hypothetical protein Q8O18_08215, partial [Deltaproteobacteria bacterium]|nr:hypothetical protein [Deltaproteobacteria bacterium]
MTYDEVREKAFSRRHFLKGLTSCAFLWAISGNPSLTFAQEEKKGYIQTKLAYHFLPLDHQRIQCQLCPRQCLVPNGRRGFCGVRENRQGKYYSLVYGNPCAVHLDPVEKNLFTIFFRLQLPFPSLPPGVTFVYIGNVPGHEGER